MIQLRATTAPQQKPGLREPSRFFRLLQNSLYHLIPQTRCLRESRCKVFLDMFKLLAIAVEVAEADAGTPVLSHEAS
jgi:hypothetical protein